MIQELNNQDVFLVEIIIMLMVLIVVHKELEILNYVKIYQIIETHVKHVKMDIE